MAAVCATPIKGRVFRMVKLDVCGAPVTGASSLVVVARSFVQVQQAPEYEDGVEFFDRTADGSICVNQQDPPTLKRLRLTVDLCQVDPDAVAYLLSARELTTSAPVSGYGFALSEGTPTNRFSFEVWQEVAGAGACSAGGLQQFVYNAWPHAGNPRIGDYTIENGKSTLQVIFTTFAGVAAWGTGPGTGTKYLPVGATGASGTEHWLWNITTNTPPTAQCGAQLLT